MRSPPISRSDCYLKILTHAACQVAAKFSILSLNSADPGMATGGAGLAMPGLAACYAPGVLHLPAQLLQALFNSAPLDGRAWMFAIAVGEIVLPIISLDKWIRIRRSANATTPTKEIR